MTADEWKAHRDFLGRRDGEITLKEVVNVVERMLGDRNRTGPDQKDALRRLSDLLLDAEHARSRAATLLGRAAC